MARITRFIGLAALATVAMPYASYLGAPRVVFDPPDGVKSAAELAAEVKSELKTATDAVKAIAEEALGKAKAGETLTNSIKEKADEALAKHTEIATRMTELEQKMVRNPGTPERRKSVGEQVTEGHEAEIAALAKGRGRFNIEVKAIISALTTDADGSAGDLIVPQRVGLVGGLERRMTVRDLLAPGRTNSNAIQYPKETGYTNSAATVTETAGTAKAQSEMKFDIATSSVTTIAHWVLATKQILDDVPMLQSYIDGRLRYGLRYVEENQLLNGGGTGTDLEGIYTAATASTANLGVVTAPTKIDVIRFAMLQASLAEYSPNGVVLHPTDWAGIETTKDTAGAYIIGNPQDRSAPRLWGLPVVATQAMTLDKFLVGSFDMGAQIFDRMGARVEISTEDASNFRQNLVTILCEERLALAIYRPEAFVKGDFSDQITDLTS
jgi:HK97 family phage major capsid protein